MERVQISFNLVNLITVTAMGAVALAALALGSQLWMRYASGGAPQQTAASGAGGY